ncbi:MAG: hypothetical protein WKG00_27985 [Polyangiaceae bacterium]
MGRWQTLTSRGALIAVFGCTGALLASCSSSSDDDGEHLGSGAASAGSGATSGSGAQNGSGGGLNPASGSGGAGGGSGKSGCEKIDFVFVVDNSVSMENEQAQLVAAFPGFISTIESTVNAGSDYHVMVVDTDEWGRCNTANPWTGIDPGSDTCNAYINGTVFEECDRTLGAGVVHPAGKFTDNAVCPFPAGRRYLAPGDPAVPATFACAAKVGVAGHSSERPMDALVAAVAAGINASGGCNEGFLRDDALLVVTFISDDANYEDAGDPQSWFDAVVAAKNGNEKAVAVVGFTPAFPECTGAGTIKGEHWKEFVAKFTFQLHAPVCSGDYAAAFAEAVQIVDESCDQFEPPPS